MTKNVAMVEATNFDELTAKLRQLGFRLECPATGFAHGFTSEGDGPIYLATQDVASFLVEGSGVLFWRGPSDSVYVSVFAGNPRIHFDGFTPAKEKAMCESLRQVGVKFSVAFDG